MRAKIVLQMPKKIYEFVAITKALSSNYGISDFRVGDNDDIIYDVLNKDDIYSILEYLTLNYYTVCVNSETRDNNHIFTFYVREEEFFDESAL